MNKPIELTNEMTQQERIAAQNVNNCKMTVELLDRIQSLENKLKLLDEEHGTSGIWEYTKKANGEYSCWTSLTVDAEINLPWDNGYISSEPSVDYPITFVDYPDPQYSYISDTVSSVLVGQGTSTIATKSRSGGFILFRPSKGHANGAIKVAVHGHWK